MKRLFKLKQGFTLIEILVVIGIIAILATIVIVAINPSRQFAQANDTQRVSNVNAILNAIGEYIADHKGAMPAALATVNGTPANISSDKINLCANLVPDYLPALPVDPKVTNGPISDCSPNYDTNYQVSTTSTNRITITAPNTESTTTPISVTR